jgi:hypothetical protein
MVLGYGETKCDSLNSLCNSDSPHIPRCVYKKYNGFTYPIFRTDNAFVKCVDEFFVNEGHETLNYYYECSEINECTYYNCSLSMFMKCRNDNSQDSLLLDFCSKYNYECAINCLDNDEKVCVEMYSSSFKSLTSKYDLCLRQCLDVEIEIHCDSTDISNCNVPECKSLLCNDCKNSNSSECNASCICESNDLDCICENQICNNKNETLESQCFFDKNLSVNPFKVTEKKKCIDICTSQTTEDDYFLCETCSNTKESCCEAILL